MKTTLAAELANVVGKDAVDCSGAMPSVTPRDEDGLAAFLRFASAGKVRIMTVGGGTTSEPVCLDETVRLSLARFDAVLDMNAGDSVVVARAGTIADRAVAAAEKERMLLPLDPTSGAKSTVGGAYMTAAVGPYTAGYGPFRDAVIGVRCLTARGDSVTFGGRTMKNVTGYEVTRFLSGTMGLFAVVVELTMRAFPLPEKRTVVLGRFSGGAAPFEYAMRMREAGTVVRSSEIVARRGLGGGVIAGIAVEGMEGAVVRAVNDVRERLHRAGAESVEEISPEEFTNIRRKDAAETVGRSLLTVNVSPSASAALLEAFRAIRPDAPVIAHPLLGRIHIRADDSRTSAAVTEKTLSMGGKRPMFQGQAVREGIAGSFSPEELAIARSLKRELDPDGILNPHLCLA